MYNSSYDVQFEVLNYLMVSGAPLYRVVPVIEALFVLYGAGGEREFNVLKLVKFKRFWSDWYTRYLNVMTFDTMGQFREEFYYMLNGAFPKKELVHE